MVFGLSNIAQRDALVEPSGAGFVSRIYASFTYGSVGPIGAHPVRLAAVAAAGPMIYVRSARCPAACRFRRSSRTWISPPTR